MDARLADMDPPNTDAGDRACTRVRRLVLAPGEAMPWHVDRCVRHTVVVRGDRLRIEFRDGRESLALDVAPGLASRAEPEPAVHRAVNVGNEVYEEVVTFLLGAPGMEPRPICD